MSDNDKVGCESSLLQEQSVAVLLSINCVIRKILPFLSIEELKSYRLVNSISNSEARNALRKRTIIEFDYLNDCVSKETGQFNIKWPNKVERYLEEMQQNFKHDRMKIQWGNFFANEEPFTEQNSEAIINLFGIVGAQIKFLEFNPSIKSEIEANTCIKILISLSNLKHLKLTLNWNCYNYDMMKNCINSIDFQLWNLTRFEIRCDDQSLQPKDICYEVIEKLLSLAPEIKRLEISRCYCRCGFSIQDYLLKINKRRGQAIQSLKDFVITDSETITEKTMKLLSNTVYNFKTLDVKISADLYEEILQAMLNRHAPFLEDLKITIEDRFVGFGNSILMPIFPKLRQLKILTSGFMELPFVFQTPEIDYNVHFPVLQNLTLGNGTECKCKFKENTCNCFFKTYKQYLPLKSGKCFNKIRILGLPLPESWKISPNVSSIEKLQYLCFIFPRAMWVDTRLPDVNVN